MRSEVSQGEEGCNTYQLRDIFTNPNHLQLILCRADRYTDQLSTWKRH